jgi:Tol biopolymer transport system component
MRFSSRTLAGTAAVVAGLVGVTAPASAQYFGQNQVEYQSFNFRVLKTQHFDIYYYPEEERAAGYAAMMAERAYARLSRLMDHEITNRQALILFASGPQFRQNNAAPVNSEGTGGVTEFLKRRIVLPFAGPLKETDHVLTHELVHAFQFDMTGAGGGTLRAGGPSVARLPLWFVEGMAEYLSLGPEDANTTMWMRDAVRADKLPNLGRLEDPRFFPYRYGQALWAYVGGRWGDESVGRVLKASVRGDLKFAFQRVLLRSADSIVHDWQEVTKKADLPLKDLTQPPEKYGHSVVLATKDEGSYNLAPVLSPDGSRMVFLSSRDLFSVDMYLADAKTGKVLKRIVRTDVDPHFESIQFISSAGAWDAAGERFVFAAVRSGRPVLSILNVPQDRIEREVALPELGEVLNPSWSPDGRYVAFSALVGGLSDLYVYDMEKSALRRLTEDAYADLQPAFSPDGKSLAWVTDRYGTNLGNLSYGSYRLATYDLESGAMKEVPGFSKGKHINPQWTPDGRALYFVSDQNGIPNIYRVELAGGGITQVTNLYAGTSGITDLSPSLSVAARAGNLSFGVYTNDGFSIYTADDPTVLAGQPVAQPLAGGDPAMLPPLERKSEVLTLKENAFFGLPTDTAGFKEEPYHARLGLDYISQPSLAVGISSFGTYIGGGASLFWSDMLGGHQMATALQFQGTARDIAALVGYSNTYHRLNWGAAVQQIPFLYAGYGYPRIDSLSGAFVLDTYLYRQTNRGGSWVFSYPFSRVQRVEGSVGYSNITFNAQRISDYFADPYFSYLLDETRENLGNLGFNALHLGQGSAALVYDNSFFGFTSPMLGQRYRLELGTTQGSLSFETALADFRKYYMPVRPFTLAFRAMTYGRYGPDAQSDRLGAPIFLGYDGLVRGYSYGSFVYSGAAECVGTVTCPNFYNLWGSRIVVGNAELRFPPLGLFHAGGPFGFLPIEMFFFGDGGYAWSGGGGAAGDPASYYYQYYSGDRKPVFSAGGGLRLNLLGFAVLEMAAVHPFNRARGTYLQFTLLPGF